MPSVFLYKRQDVDGDLIYDVIDGKQRLESIFMFMGLGYFRRDRYWAWTKLSPKDEEPDWYDWPKVRRKNGEYTFSSYRIQTVEVSGDLSDIIDVFVRINSTGKKLTSAEKRHARYYNSPFLKMAGKLAECLAELLPEAPNPIACRYWSNEARRVDLRTDSVDC